MSEPVNLNKARKAKARAARTQQAAENRVKFGRTKAQKQADKATKTRTAKEVDGLKRER